METIRKIIFTAVALAIVGIAAYGIMRGTAVPEVVQKEVPERNPCSVDAHALSLKDPENLLKTDEEIARAMFDHYYSFYTSLPECPALSLKSYRIVEVGEIKRIDETNFTADIVFELEPVSIGESEWDTPETSVEGSWIRNKEGMLSIRRTTDGYFLNVLGAF